jgi:hypothetical protein
MKNILQAFTSTICKLNIYYTQGDHCNRPGFTGTVQTYFTKIIITYIAYSYYQLLTTNWFSQFIVYK